MVGIIKIMPTTFETFPIVCSLLQINGSTLEKSHPITGIIVMALTVINVSISQFFF